jgi:hypothetical protein
MDVTWMTSLTQRLMPVAWRVTSVFGADDESWTSMGDQQVMLTYKL